jgi:periplasmic protein TonB
MFNKILAWFFQLINQNIRRLLIIKTKVMSKLNMNKKEWLDLVFEGKNKEYGAYQMRQEESKTTTKAFFSAIALIAGIAMLPVVLSSFAEKPAIVEFKPEEVLHVTDVYIKKEEIKKAETAAKREIPKKTEVKNPLLKVAKKEDTPNKPVPVTKPTDNNPIIDNSNTGLGKGLTNPVIGGGGPEIVPEIPEGPFIPKVLDKEPSFPGGIDEFTKTVGRKFVTPEIEEEKTIKILVYFIVERDGTLSNITVPKNPGFDLDKEAIRVLKSIKTKWEPGIYKGQPVRTSYSLPIVIKMQ